jgi:hypothetical protein
MIPNRYRILWFALNGGLLGGSFGFSFLLLRHLTYNSDLFSTLLYNPARLRDMLMEQLILVTAIWGMFEGVYLAWESDQNRRAKALGNIAAVIALVLVSVYLLASYHYWWTFNIFRQGYYFYFSAKIDAAACLGICSIGLVLARKNWLKLCHLPPTATACHWLFSIDL